MINRIIAIALIGVCIWKIKHEDTFVWVWWLGLVFSILTVFKPNLLNTKSNNDDWINHDDDFGNEDNCEHDD